MSATSCFADSVTIITGGSGGIGGCVAQAVLDRGGRVAVLDTAEPAPGPDLFLYADVRDPASVDEAVARVAGQLGAVDHLVCAAGVDTRSALGGLGPEEWHRVVDVSLTGSYLAMHAVVPAMVERRRGTVVAFSSGWATKGCADGAHLAAGKAGVEALAKSVALESAVHGVRVNAIAPGPVRTPMTMDNPGFDAARRAADIPMGRIGEAAEMVGPTLFLLSPESSYITGQVLHVNGGMLMP